MRREEKLILGEESSGEPLSVRRVFEELGPHRVSSHIEPELGQDWEDIDKLRWHAGVLLADHNIKVCVSEMSPGMFSLHGATPYGGWGHSAMNFGRCWDYLNGMAQAAVMIEGRR